MKKTFDFNFDLYYAVWIHINIKLKEKLSMITCKLVLRKKLVKNKNLNKSRHHCIDIITYHSNHPKKIKSTKVNKKTKKSHTFYSLKTIQPYTSLAT